MTGFEATAGQLQASGSALDEVAREPRAAVDALGREVEGLLASGWRGPAASGFARGWAEWRDGALEVLSALEAMADLLGDTGRGYDAAEQASYDTVSRSGGDG